METGNRLTVTGWGKRKEANGGKTREGLDKEHV